MKWLLLCMAVVLEVMGTTAMKLSDGLSKPIYVVAIVICYVGSLFSLTLTLKYFEVSTVYAIWSGLGVSCIAVIGVLYFGESLTVWKVVSLVLICIGIVGLQLSGTKH